MNNFYKEVGMRIQKARVMRGYTREGLSELAGISTKFIYEIENGKKGFSAENLHNICKVLKMDCDYILTGCGKSDCDKRLWETIKLFSANQSDDIEKLLRFIYEMKA